MTRPATDDQTGPTPNPAETTPAAATPAAVPTAVVAAGSLVAGFAVAQATDVRALGGVVLLAGAAWCGRQWWRRGPVTTVGLLVGYAGAFAGSHVLARGIGAWPSVISVSAAVGLASWVAADRHRS